MIYRPNCVASLLAGYDGSMNKWDDNHRYLSQDGVEIRLSYKIFSFNLSCDPSRLFCILLHILNIAN